MLDRRPASVVIVDDDAASLYATSRLLAIAGFEVVRFASPDAARELLEARSVDAVVTDYWMREMTGAELLASVRARLGERTPPFVLITAMIAPIPWSQRKAFAGTLEKPFPFVTLESILRGAIAADRGRALTSGAV